VSCPVCKKVYHRTWAMNDHYKLVHLRKINYYCGSCSRRYYNSLRRAAAGVVGRRSKPIQTVAVDLQMSTYLIHTYIRVGGQDEKRSREKPQSPTDEERTVE
ncbi:hypothetical protein KGM_204903B, partial [Danaus plexippus plexippus]